MRFAFFKRACTKKICKTTWYIDSNITKRARWEKIHSFIVIKALSVTVEQLNKNSQACPNPPWKKKFFFGSPTPTPHSIQNLLHGPCYCKWCFMHRLRVFNMAYFGNHVAHFIMMMQVVMSSYSFPYFTVCLPFAEWLHSCYINILEENVV